MLLHYSTDDMACLHAMGTFAWPRLTITEMVHVYMSHILLLPACMCIREQLHCCQHHVLHLCVEQGQHIQQPISGKLVHIQWERTSATLHRLKPLARPQMQKLHHFCFGVLQCRQAQLPAISPIAQHVNQHRLDEFVPGHSTPDSALTPPGILLRMDIRKHPVQSASASLDRSC